MNSTQHSFTASGCGTSQVQRGLRHLLAHRGKWVPMPELERVSGAARFNSRASNIRDLGYVVENRRKKVGRKMHSFYRIP